MDEEPCFDGLQYEIRPELGGPGDPVEEMTVEQSDVEEAIKDEVARGRRSGSFDLDGIHRCYWWFK